MESDVSDSPGVSAESPWLGLRSFTEELREYFFGREVETKRLFECVSHRALTVLFGKSGLGKTSLLRAGLIPLLREEGYRPALVRLRYDPDSPPLLAQVVQSLADSLSVSNHDLGLQMEGFLGRTVGDLWAGLHDPDSPLANRGLQLTLIFDQFEELFTLGQEKQERQQDARELLEFIACFVENRPPADLKERLKGDDELADRLDYSARPIRLVISLREDFLHRLERHRKEIPSMMENRLELLPLSGPKAFLAAYEPGCQRTRGLEFDELEESGKASPILTPEGARNIVRFVAGATADVPIEEIDNVPPLLSLICEQLNNRRLEEAADTINAEDLRSSAPEILQRFYEDCFTGRLPAVREFVESKLVSSSGFREVITLETAEGELRSAGVPDGRSVIRELVDQRLLVIEDQRGATRIELTHDILANLAVRSKRDRQERQEALRREEEVARMEERERESRRARKRLIYVVALLTLLVVVTGAMSFIARGASLEARAMAAEAEAAEEKALVRAEENEQLRKLAEESSRIAEQAKSDADAARKEAEKQAGLAEVRREEAVVAEKNALARAGENEQLRKQAEEFRNSYRETKKEMDDLREKEKSASQETIDRLKALLSSSLALIPTTEAEGLVKLRQEVEINFPEISRELNEKELAALPERSMKLLADAGSQRANGEFSAAIETAKTLRAVLKPALQSSIEPKSGQISADFESRLVSSFFEEAGILREIGRIDEATKSYEDAHSAVSESKAMDESGKEKWRARIQLAQADLHDDRGDAVSATKVRIEVSNYLKKALGENPDDKALNELLFEAALDLAAVDETLSGQSALSWLSDSEKALKNLDGENEFTDLRKNRFTLSKAQYEFAYGSSKDGMALVNESLIADDGKTQAREQDRRIEEIEFEAECLRLRASIHMAWGRKMFGESSDVERIKGLEQATQAISDYEKSGALLTPLTFRNETKWLWHSSSGLSVLRAAEAILESEPVLNAIQKGGANSVGLSTSSKIGLKSASLLLNQADEAFKTLRSSGRLLPRHEKFSIQLQQRMKDPRVTLVFNGPNHYVAIPGTDISISDREVSRSEFRLFIEETRHQPTGKVYTLLGAKPSPEVPYPCGDRWAYVDGVFSWENPGFEQSDDHPVVAVSWRDAVAFAAWLERRYRASGDLTEDYKIRLPTSEEWEKMVEFVNTNGGPFPWGVWPPRAEAGNFAGKEITQSVIGPWFEKYQAAISPVAGFSDSFLQTAPVVTPEIAPVKGIHNLIGNVAEYLDDHDSAKRYYVGGGWHDATEQSVHPDSSKRSNAEDAGYIFVGFRVVKVPK